LEGIGEILIEETVPRVHPHYLQIAEGNRGAI
jgi:hypothetical protein